MAYHTWSEIRHADKEGKATVIPRGKRIAKSDLPGISDLDWEAMIQGGSVRDRKFPAPDGFQGSAIDFLRDSLREAQSVSQVDEEEAFGELAEVTKSSSSQSEVVQSEGKKSGK